MTAATAQRIAARHETAVRSPLGVLMMPWTLERLQNLSLKEREVLFDNARTHPGKEADEIIRLLVDHDLLVREGGGLSRDHPVIQAMEEVIRSPEGRRAGKEASDAGQPALAGIDPMLSGALGADYGQHDTTSWAGTLTAEIMAEAGYVQTRKAAMPPSCVAKTAAFFEKRR